VRRDEFPALRAKKGSLIGRAKRKPARARKKVAVQRMLPAEREQEIVQKAISFFAERGFEGNTRELAERLNITQPLLYFYFPNKEALIERVYQDVFVGRWNAQWEQRILDRSRPIKARLSEFYQDYAKAIVTHEWVRLFMFSGLKGLDFNSRYLRLLRERIFGKIIEELRLSQKLKPIAEIPLTNMEIEAVWSLHATIFYLGVRKWIYNMPVPDDLGPIIEMKVTMFIDGIGAILARDAPNGRPRRAR
jgi:AcrR family transcriptional regulator